MPPLTPQEIAYLNSVSPMLRQQYLDAKAAQMGGQQQQMQQQPQQAQPQGQGGLLQSILGGTGGQQGAQQVAKPAGQNLWQSIFGSGGGSAAASEGASSLTGLTGAAGGGSEVAASGFGEGLGSMMGGGSEAAASGFGEGLGSMMGGGGAVAEGGLASSATAAGPYAAAALAAYLGARGLGQAKSTWDLGHGRQQQAVSQAINPVATGALDVFGLSNNKNATRALNYINPISMPLQIASDLGINFWSGKDKDQQQRDYIREGLQKSGLVDKNWQMDLGDNTSFDLGKDGKNTLANIGSNIDGKAERHYYDVDWSDPTARSITDILDPLSAQYLNDYEVGSKQRSDLTGMLYNRVKASSDPQAALKALVAKMGGDPNTATISQNKPGLTNYMNNTGADMSGFKGVFKANTGDRTSLPNGISHAIGIPQSGQQMQQQGLKVGYMDASNMPDWLKNAGIDAKLASSPAIPVNNMIDKNAGKKPGDAGYDWNYARAQRKGQARW